MGPVLVYMHDIVLGTKSVGTSSAFFLSLSAYLLKQRRTYYQRWTQSYSGHYLLFRSAQCSDFLSNEDLSLFAMGTHLDREWQDTDNEQAIHVTCMYANQLSTTFSQIDINK